MNILYRRFLLVAALIATMGIVTANVIQETRTARTHQINGLQILTPGFKTSCNGEKLCAVSPNAAFIAAITVG